MELSVRDNLSITEITKEAFAILGENGVIRAADQHACSECTHDYIATTSDNIATASSAAVVGVDDDDELSHQAASSLAYPSLGSDNDMEIDKAPVKLMVVDGICFGPKHCAYENCSEDLVNYHTEVFCPLHQQTYGAKCRIRNCDNLKVKETQACQQHQQEWKKYVTKHKRQSTSGFRKITQ